MDLTGIATVALAVVTLLSLAVAIMALRRASVDAKAARTAELSWNVYQAYDSRELREGRRALNTVSREQPVPATGEEFGAMYVTNSYDGPQKDDVERRAKKVSKDSIRRMLRFYHQIGILLSQELIDADFVFPLIGDGLQTSERGIRVATEWHQNFYSGESGNEKAAVPRSIYELATKLPEDYDKWKKGQEPQLRGLLAWIRSHILRQRRTGRMTYEPR